MLKRHYYRYSMLAPGLCIFLIFFVWPAISNFFYAFTNLDATFHYTRLVGFENFISLFDDSSNSIAFKNTFIFTVVTTVGKVGLGFILANFVNQKLRSTNFLRSALFFPVILSPIAVSLAFTALFHPSRGFINVLLENLHLGFLTQQWLTNSHIVMYSISFVEIWKWTGLTVILFLAALQTIPKEMIEAAKIDGATNWEQKRHIIFPMILPVVNTNIIISLIGGLKVFDIVYALTGGGPGNASSVINTMIYKSFSQGRNGEATAASLLLFVIILVLVSITNKYLNKDNRG
ncbi:carbohydrate ABC transporter permease [Paenibacillus sp. 2TAB26]|uniref:carbohydrate ABC transporter permease n=1 Tax=Paenibacillus sp. 2TAB26 TaxID=3233005 RepID=UPI003F9E0CCA